MFHLDSCTMYSWISSLTISSCRYSPSYSISLLWFFSLTKSNCGFFLDICVCVCVQESQKRKPFRAEVPGVFRMPNLLYGCWDQSSLLLNKHYQLLNIFFPVPLLKCDLFALLCFVEGASHSIAQVGLSFTLWPINVKPRALFFLQSPLYWDYRCESLCWGLQDISVPVVSVFISTYIIFRSLTRILVSSGQELLISYLALVGDSFLICSIGVLKSSSQVCRKVTGTCTEYQPRNVKYTSKIVISLSFVHTWNPQRIFHAVSSKFIVIHWKPTVC